MTIRKPKAILICGKICCGKTTYAKPLLKKEKAVLLSCDEISLSLFPDGLGEKHDEVMPIIKGYLYKKSLEIIEAGASVVLDWGFWSKAERKYARDFYFQNGTDCELHYIDLTDERRLKNIKARNEEVKEKKISAYFADEGLIQKCDRLFEPPSENEINVFFKYGSGDE
ncbi:MAG: ATP-binding protein [Bacteroides sp.]|nr:ATP-binding protein [Bacteroides sp.]